MNALCSAFKVDLTYHFSSGIMYKEHYPVGTSVQLISDWNSISVFQRNLSCANFHIFIQQTAGGSLGDVLLNCHHFSCLTIEVL